MNPIEQRISQLRERQSVDETALFGQQLAPEGSSTRGTIAGRPVVLAGTNNYLGLTFHPELIEAAVEATRRYGTGTTGSRMANGTYPDHVLLERELCEHYEARSATVFTTGYQANLATISGLADRDGVLVLDADCHASIYDGAKLCGAEIYRFRHNDATDLERKLTRLKGRGAIVIIEGIYSMLGDTAPLRDICGVVQHLEAALVLDEAHSFGVLGRTGRGLAEHLEVEDQVDVIVGTFSKSAACLGGFCVSRRHDLQELRSTMRPYMFSASMSPAVVAATRVALSIIRREPQLRRTLKDNADQVYSALRDLGFELGPEPSPIIAITLPDDVTTVEIWHRLVDLGVYVNLVLPPAGPANRCLLRCSVSAAHTPSDIDRIVTAFTTVAEEMSVRTPVDVT